MEKKKIKTVKKTTKANSAKTQVKAKHVKIHAKAKPIQAKANHRKTKQDYTEGKPTQKDTAVNTDINEKEKRKKLLLELMHDPIYKPMRLKELCILLDVPKEERDSLEALLEELISEGRLSVNARGKYGKPELFSLTGVYEGNARGFGFVRVENREEDVFIPQGAALDALHGDTVRFVIEKEGGSRRAEGRIIQVLSRANTELVGLFRKNKSFGFVIPDNQKIQKDIFVSKEDALLAEDGDKVMVRITKYGDRRSNPEGVITEIIGKSGAPGVDILSLVKAYGLPETFPPEVAACLETVPDTVPREAMEGRRDLRNVQMVTIDGEDAKDLDDAVSLSYNEATGLYRLGVHIADVSEYVKENSPLDKEALLRGTSVYLTDRVIPMLPRKLSNGICSLNQGEDRLSLSCLMTVDEKGRIVDHEIVESVIRVDRRMSYKNVYAIIGKGDRTISKQYADYVPMLMQMKKLSGLLRAQRRNRGGIDFDFPESKITLDKKGKPIKIEPYLINDANRLIEDFMLAANETVAEEFYWRELPFLYRTHEPPTAERMQELTRFVEGLGISVKHVQDEEVHPKQIQALLSKIEGNPSEALIERVALRSMKQARYTVDCVGHFGLAAKYYTHFTSPIRRYPDLQIHRIIKELLHEGTLSEERITHYEKLLPEVALKTSASERRAEEAERECEKMKKCEYMRQHIGAEFDGVISGVTAFGFYVELPNTCEGMVHVTTLTDDYYSFNEQRMELSGERTLRSYRLGQKVHIMVTDADKLMRTVDFRLVAKSEPEEAYAEEAAAKTEAAKKKEKSRKRGRKG